MSMNAQARRLEHRANLRKVASGQLGEEETKAVKTTEATRVGAIKAPVVLNRKQRKNRKSQRRNAK